MDLKNQLRLKSKGWKIEFFSYPPPFKTESNSFKEFDDYSLNRKNWRTLQKYTIIKLHLIIVIILENLTFK